MTTLVVVLGIIAVLDVALVAILLTIMRTPETPAYILERDQRMEETNAELLEANRERNAHLGVIRDTLFFILNELERRHL